MGDGRRVFGLDLLRAVAVGLVLVCHTADFLFPLTRSETTRAWMQTTDIGVDLFFVLSGFLIGGILLRELERGASLGRLWHFWSRRWWRTLPNYYLFLVIYMVWNKVMLGFRPRVPAFLVFSQGLLENPPTAYHIAWSLCVEEWFYLLFALLAFALTAGFRSGRAYLGAAAAVGLAAFALRAWLYFVLDSYVVHSTLCRLDSLMFGVAAAYLAARRPVLWLAARRPAAVAGLAVLCVGLVVRAITPYAGPAIRLVSPDVVALGVALLLPWLSGWRECPGNTGVFVTRVSLYSYSFYLVHPLIMFLIGTGIGVPDSVAAAVVLTPFWYVASFAASALCYHLYELPMTRLRDIDWRDRLSRLAPVGDRVPVAIGVADDEPLTLGAAQEDRDVAIG